MTAGPIGILGGGQLGRMLALAGYRLGLRFRFLDPASDAPVGQLGDLVVGDYDDPDALHRFADGLALATFEFENVPVTTARHLAQRVPLWPPPVALSTAQDRLHEKSLFARLDIPTPTFAAVDDRASLAAAVHRVGAPAMLKTRRLGYDGKGQFLLENAQDAGRAWQALAGVPLLLEEFVPFEREVSILAVRGRTGETAYYPITENHHERGILRMSLAPACDSGDLQRHAERYVARVLDDLHYVGVLAIEFFVFNGRLLANEMAPRVHNSGHWTIEGTITSQFENHLRALLGWPLGATSAVGKFAMLNLISTLPPVEAMLAVPGAGVHLYGKEARAGRKLGHVTLWNRDPMAFADRLAELRTLVGFPANDGLSRL